MIDEEEHGRRRMLARSAIAERLKALAGRDVPFHQIAGDCYSVGNGQFIYYPSTGYWRGLRGSHGYTLGGLLQAYEAYVIMAPIVAHVIESEQVALPQPAKQIAAPVAEANPAVGSDSAKEQPDPDLSPAPLAESTAGTPSTSLLMQNKWP